MKAIRCLVACLALGCAGWAAQAAEIKTADGLSIKLPDQTGGIEAIEVKGEPLPLLQARLPLRVREYTPPDASWNLAPNPGFEKGEAAPESWPGLGQGTARVRESNHTPNGRYCGKASAPPGATPDAPASSGQFQSARIPAMPNTPYLFRAWGLVPQGGSGGCAFVVELDAKGQIIWEGKYHVQHSLGWANAAPGQWTQKEASFVTKPNCAQFHLYATVWKGYGAFYFDDIELFDLANSWKDLPLAPAPPVKGTHLLTPSGGASPLPPVVVASTDGKAWRQRLSCADGQLDIELTYTPHKDHIRIDVAIQDTHTPVQNRAIQVQYILPINGTGWTWHDDGRRHRDIASAETACRNSFSTGGGLISRYPFTSITKGGVGISLGAPMDRPRVQDLAYEPGQGYETAVNLGLSPLTKRIGEGKATFSAVIFAHEGEWGLRAAAKKYYEVFPEYFVKRAQREGMWFYVVPPRSIPNIEDFGLTFYEGGPLTPEDTAFAHQKGIYILPYTEPWGARQVFPKIEKKEDLPPYEERLAGLKQWAADKQSPAKLLGGPRWEIAQAILNSLPYDKYGKAPFHVDKYGTWAQWWMTITNPNLPTPNRGTTCWQYEIEPVLSRSDGIYLDSVSFWLANFLNYREDHFASAATPLAFDPLTGRPALLGMASHYEFMTWLAERLHAQGKLVHMNIFPESYRFCAHLADVLGSEVSSRWGGKKRDFSDVESDEDSLMRRMLAYQKPTSNLLQEGNFTTPVPELSQAEVEQYIKHQMFYGFYPGIATIGGEDKPGYIGWKRYFGTPAQFERDRSLFKKYIPIIRELCAAGWEPVTGAKTSCDSVFIERFGSWEKDNLHFTLRNSSEKEEHFSVALQGVEGKIIVRDLVSGSVLATKAEFPMALPMKDTAVIKVERQGEQ